MRDLQPILDELRAFRDQRDWAQFHNPKDLAISISLEAAELLEAFQWSGADTSAAGRQDKIAEELADVLIYCLLMADATGLDPLEIVEDKIALNGRKYPLEASRGTARKYTEL
jgi:NTP pyrophosphatase (non-canonical NTP hydrolase)